MYAEVSVFNGLLVKGFVEQTLVFRFFFFLEKQNV